jgi:hypothetical protein
VCPQLRQSIDRSGPNLIEAQAILLGRRHREQPWHPAGGGESRGTRDGAGRVDLLMRGRPTRLYRGALPRGEVGKLLGLTGRHARASYRRVAAARALECRELFSEDMSHGREVEGVTIINPFR